MRFALLLSSVTITPDMINLAHLTTTNSSSVRSDHWRGAIRWGWCQQGKSQILLLYHCNGFRDKTKPVLVLHQNIVVDLGATGHVNPIPACLIQDPTTIAACQFCFITSC
ncbi:MAG: hypothetical protein IPH36_16905 [Saprospiraceae bacterium]|nr:hypothetical protein [Saprospiraceae bacterium]